MFASYTYSGIADAKITIVTYGLLSCKSSAAVKEALQAQQFKVAICDESHYFKNSRTECCKAVTSLLTAAKRCLLLTGTPALARPSEVTQLKGTPSEVMLLKGTPSEVRQLKGTPSEVTLLKGTPSQVTQLKGTSSQITQLKGNQNIEVYWDLLSWNRKYTTAVMNQFSVLFAQN